MGRTKLECRGLTILLQFKGICRLGPIVVRLHPVGCLAHDTIGAKRKEVGLVNSAPILVIDDEPAIGNMIAVVLRREGFENIHLAGTGADGVLACQSLSPELIVLDVMLPDMDGFEVCRQCRELSDAPILFLTARSTDLDKLMGFGMGGDDYITKPFNPLEVAARVKSHLRRRSRYATPTTHSYDFGRFQVIESSGELVVEGTSVVCPAREFQLLLFFCQHPNRLFSRAQLYEHVWGIDRFGDDTTVMVHIRRLREKIEVDPARPQYLLTVRGLGYKLVNPDQRADRR